MERGGGRGEVGAIGGETICGGGEEGALYGEEMAMEGDMT